MIRINLLGRNKGQKGGKRSFSLPRIPNVGLLLALLILVIEGAVAFQWSQQAAEDANKLESKARKLKEEVDDYGKIKTEADELKHKLEDGNKEKLIFDELFAQKIGPADALTYLAFILAPRKEAEVPGDELKQMELAGWRVNWPGEKTRAWLTGIHEKEGEVTLIGGAVDHGDVAEVARRLESSAHFREMKLVSQERKVDPVLGVPYIEFTIRGSLIYLLDPYKVPGETPEGEAPPEAAAAGDATAGDGGADAGGETTTMLKSNLLPTPDATAGETDGADADAHETKEEPDSGPPPIVPTPVAPRAEAEPVRQPASPPLIEHAVEPPPAERGSDPSDPGSGATAQPAEPSNPNPAPAGNP